MVSTLETDTITRAVELALRECIENAVKLATDRAVIEVRHRISERTAEIVLKVLTQYEGNRLVIEVKCPTEGH